MESELICLFVCVAHLLFVAIHVLGLSSFARQQKTDASQHEQRTIPRLAHQQMQFKKLSLSLGSTMNNRLPYNLTELLQCF